MGLKWFRARFSIEKEASKIPAMAGLYRRVSYSESAIWKNAGVSTAPSSIASDSTASDNKTAQYDRSKADLTNQLSSSIFNLEETTVKDNDKKLQVSDHTVENTEPSTSTKDVNIKEQLTCSKESNKMTKDQNDKSDTKNSTYLDNELVI